MRRSKLAFVDTTGGAIVKSIFTFKGESPALKMSGKQKSNAIRTLALLCLIAHALFVSATHFHGIDRLYSSAAAAIATTDGDSHSATDTSGDSHCISCRLQRNFISDLRTPSVTLELFPKGLICETFLSTPCLRGPFLVVSDRAPPLV